MFSSFSCPFSIFPGLFPLKGCPLYKHLPRFPSWTPFTMSDFYLCWCVGCPLPLCDCYCWVCILFALLDCKFCAQNPSLSKPAHFWVKRVTNQMVTNQPDVMLFPRNQPVAFGLLPKHWPLYLSPGRWDGGESGRVTVVWVVVISLPFYQSGGMGSWRHLTDPHFTDMLCRNIIHVLLVS